MVGERGRVGKSRSELSLTKIRQQIVQVCSNQSTKFGDCFASDTENKVKIKSRKPKAELWAELQAPIASG